MAKNFSLKDQLFNAEKVSYLAGLFRAQNPEFDPNFETRCLSRFPELELKERIAWIAECLVPALPDDFPEAADQITAALPPPLDPTLRDDDFGDFIFCPLGEYAVLRGLEDHPDRALVLLEEVTQRFSMEYAIRHFLKRWPDRTYARLNDWAEHSSYHVRRLVSEGTRPRLPWGAGITTDPAHALPLLDRLHSDPTRFVTRSVANHLNDISKKDAAPVLRALTAWSEAGRQEPKELAWMTKHALRDLVKKGDPQALRLLGYDPGAELGVALSLPATAQIGEAVQITTTLTSATDLAVLVDYVMTFARPGGRSRQKVHKLAITNLDAGQPLSLTKRHKLPADATTYSLHPGPHEIAIQVNGIIRTRGIVTLTA
ncbi:DNA alkylation repair protein [Pseudooceanicola sp. MF1-13]|uniref:DNA alkylation repair protein n=1 Tax=Pseudooceanicola sp. MF1-13 TaxID=3379095 RepID=UPI003891489A